MCNIYVGEIHQGPIQKPLILEEQRVFEHHRQIRLETYSRCFASQLSAINGAGSEVISLQVLLRGAVPS